VKDPAGNICGIATQEDWKNFRQRIELCLNEELHPFYVEF
jgi:hypothetical protein